MKVIVSERADADLLGIFRYLVERNPAAAEAAIRRIDQKFNNLSRFPFIGRERTTLAADLRSIASGVHVIFYTVEHDRVVIVRVLDGRRDIDAEFQR
jgi:toxin ParE1/3/4